MEFLNSDILKRSNIFYLITAKHVKYDRRVEVSVQWYNY